MPNYCHNKLTIRGDDEDVAAFRQKAQGYAPWVSPNSPEGTPNPLNFHSLVPIPPELQTPRYQDAADSIWQKENWGCRGGAQGTEIVLDEDDPGVITYEFATSWSPPVAFCEAVAKQWPDLMLVLEYMDPNGAYQGLAKFEGHRWSDHSISL